MAEYFERVKKIIIEQLMWRKKMSFHSFFCR